MRVCFKKNCKVDGRVFHKHEEGFTKSVKWSEDGIFYYLVEFADGKSYYIDSSHIDVLRC